MIITGRNSTIGTRITHSKLMRLWITRRRDRRDRARRCGRSRRSFQWPLVGASLLIAVLARHSCRPNRETHHRSVRSMARSQASISPRGFISTVPLCPSDLDHSENRPSVRLVCVSVVFSYPFSHLFLVKIRKASNYSHLTLECDSVTNEID